MQMEPIEPWEYLEALETMIPMLIRARDLHWGKFTIYTVNDESGKWLKLEIADPRGKYHWFKATGDCFVRVPTEMVGVF